MRDFFGICLLLLLIISCGDNPAEQEQGSLIPSTLAIELVDQTSSSGKVSGLRLISSPEKSSSVVQAEWTTCSSDLFDAYELYRSYEPDIESQSSPLLVKTLSVSNLTSAYDTLSYSGTVYYALKTVGSNDESVWSNEDSIAVNISEPPTPSELEGIVNFDDCVLSWNMCPDFDFNSYILYRSTQPDIYLNPEQADIIMIELDRAVEAYTDTTSNWNTEYYYSLSTLNNDTSIWSNEISIRTPVKLPSAVVDSVQIDYPCSMAMDYDSNYLYVLEYLTHAVHKIDLNSLNITVSNEISASWSRPIYILNEELICSYKTINNYYYMYFYDVNTFSCNGSVEINGGISDYTVSPYNDKVYIVNDSTLYIIDASTYVIEQENSVGGSSITYSEETDQVLVYSDDYLYVYNAQTLEVEEYLYIGDCFRLYSFGESCYWGEPYDLKEYDILSSVITEYEDPDYVWEVFETDNSDYILTLHSENSPAYNYSYLRKDGSGVVGTLPVSFEGYQIETDNAIFDSARNCYYLRQFVDGNIYKIAI